MKINILKILGTILFVSTIILGLVRLNLAPAQAATNPRMFINSITTSNHIDDKALTSSWKGLRTLNNYANDGVSLLDPSQVSVANQKLFVQSGWVILSKNGEYQINNTNVSLQKGILFFEIENNAFYLFDGEAKIDGLALDKNSTLKNGVIESLQRQEFTKPVYTELVTTLTEEKLLPAILSDFVSPILTITSPQDQDKTGETNLTVTGTTEIGASLKINQVVVAVGDLGQFSSVINSVDPETVVEVTASDTWQNTTTKSITVIYDRCLKIDCIPQTPVLVPSPVTQSNTISSTPSQAPTLQISTTIRSDSSVGCENQMFNYQFLQILNQYRQSKGMNTLDIENNLALAACDHAKYMSENGIDSFSHTGVNGSNPVERCQNRGTYCDSENLAYSSPDNTPQKMFDLYKASAGHNANMLGTHTVVGIAWAGIFNVCDFR